MSGEATKERTSAVPENLNCTHVGGNDDVSVNKRAYFYRHTSPTNIAFP